MSNNIPAVFWYSASLCLLVATTGLTYTAYLSSSISIEIANTKITLLSAIDGTQKLAREVENKYERSELCQSGEDSQLESYRPKAEAKNELQIINDQLSRLRKTIIDE